MEPLVSVVIPTFNRLATVTEAIDSALSQSHAAVEVIVVDDGSTDGTGEALRRRHETDPRVVVVSRPNGGVAAARNAGLREVRGEYVAFLDSDDAWLPWKLEIQVACLEREPDIGMTWTDLSAVDGDRVVAERFLRTMYRNIRDRRLGDVFTDRRQLGADAPAKRPDLARVPIYSGDIFPIMLSGSIVHTSTVVMRTRVLEKVGDFDETLRPNGEDFDFHLRTTEIAPVGFIDVPAIRYRVGSPDQLSGPDRMVVLARNGLRTVRSRLDAVGDDARVTPAVRAAAIANAEAWLGRELVDSGSRMDALAHLVRAWRAKPSMAVMRSGVRAVLPGWTLRLRSGTASADRGADSG